MRESTGIFQLFAEGCSLCSTFVRLDIVSFKQQDGKFQWKKKEEQEQKAQQKKHKKKTKKKGKGGSKKKDR